MNTKSKNVSQIIILMILTTLLLSACVDNSITLQTAPETVNESAEQIASFDLPVGFQPEINAEMLGYTLVSYKGSSDMSHLYLVYSENEADEEKLTDILENSLLDHMIVRIKPLFWKQKPCLFVVKMHLW